MTQRVAASARHFLTAFRLSMIGKVLETMPIVAKLSFTIVVVFLAAVFCTVGRTRFKWLSDPAYWTLGASNPLRWALFDEDGDLRRTGVLAVYAAMLVFVWLT
jgi:hypothetical protein